MDPSVSSSLPEFPIYVFNGVRVDTGARRLWVDGEERRVQPLVFNLLGLLCEKPFQVIGRDLLFQRLWPDRTFPSDESLSQLVFKLRAHLSGYGSAIVTLRHVGLRLDASVRTESAELPPPSEFADGADDAASGLLSEESTPAIASTAEPDERQTVASDVGESGSGAPAAQPLQHVRWRPGRATVIAAVLALLAVAVGVHVYSRSELDAGYGLRVADLGTWRLSSIETIREALNANTRGQRSRAIALLETVTATDPHTPVPPLLLAKWWGQEGDDRGPKMAAEFHRRLAAGASDYLHLFGAQLLGTTPVGEPIGPGHLDLLLDARPGAFRFRLARAHRAIAEVDLATARADLAAIPIDDLAAPVQQQILIDRIAAGDGQAVAALLSTLPVESADARLGAIAVRAWLALDGGSPSEALAQFESGIVLTANQPASESRRALHMAAAIAAGRMDRFDLVRAHLERARATAMNLGQHIAAAEAGLLLLAVPDFDAATRQAMADEMVLWSKEFGPYTCLDAKLVFALIGDARDPCTLDSNPTSAALRGMQSVLSGFAAQRAGELDLARARIRTATADGAEQGLLAPYLRVLAIRSGLPATAARAGLWTYPLPTRQAASWWESAPSPR